MKFSRIIANSGEWLSGDGPNRHIVVSSRVRLARNLRDKPFPGWAKKSERLDVMNLVKQAVEHLPEMAESYSENLEALSPLEKQVLVERHLISREHAAKGVGRPAPRPSGAGPADDTRFGAVDVVRLERDAA